MATDLSGNPFREQAEREGLTPGQHAERLGLSINQVRTLYSGQATYVPVKWRERLTAAGLDFPKVRREYAIWRDKLHGSGEPMVIDREKLNDLQRAVVDALYDGVRGVRNLAAETGVPRPLVEAFLKSDHFRAS